mgnify:CR=1 FL=1
MVVTLVRTPCFKISSAHQQAQLHVTCGLVQMCDPLLRPFGQHSKPARQLASVNRTQNGTMVKGPNIPKVPKCKVHHPFKS